jgi:probable rRNA maturation factor
MMASSEKEQDITVQIAKYFDVPDTNIARLKKLVKTVCKRFRLAKATVGVAIVNDAEIKRLNKKFLNLNTATDCLSFDLTDEQARPAKRKSRKRQEKSVPGHERSGAKIFELVVNGEKAVKEAKIRGHSTEAELALYVTHGLLHNLGFDDATKADAKKMHETEDEILQELGYGLVYNKGTRAQEQKGTKRA